MKPPFRADQVGSLLRPGPLAAARAQFKQGALSAETLRRVEDDCIRRIVAQQRSIGLRSITDGELRRDYWHIDFLRRLDGVTDQPPTIAQETSDTRNRRHSARGRG